MIDQKAGTVRKARKGGALVIRRARHEESVKIDEKEGSKKEGGRKGRERGGKGEHFDHSGRSIHIKFPKVNESDIFGAISAAIGSSKANPRLSVFPNRKIFRKIHETADNWIFVFVQIHFYAPSIVCSVVDHRNGCESILLGNVPARVIGN